MLKVQYSGPKVKISNHGITYITSKEDKYIYLMAALILLESIDNDYQHQHSYKHHYLNKVLDDNEMYKILITYENELENRIDETIKKFEMKIQHEIEQVQKMKYLSLIDKAIWIKNIELMKPYRIQRKINKIYYRHCIQNIIVIIKKKRIKKITTPFNKIFFHVLNSIRGTLLADIYGLKAKVKEEADSKNNVVAILYIGT